MNLTEAFRALNALNEDTFSVSDDGINKLSDFEQNDDLSDEISVIDTEAETEEDLEGSYVGKVILDCGVCHSKIYKDKSEVELNEDQTLANVGEECPYCYTSDGFKVIGEVAEFGGEDEEEETEVEDAEDVDDNADDAVEESLQEGIFDMFKKNKSSNPIAIGEIAETHTFKPVKASDLKKGDMVFPTSNVSETTLKDAIENDRNVRVKTIIKVKFDKKGNYYELWYGPNGANGKLARADDVFYVAVPKTNESLEESVNAVNVETDDETISFSTDENGNVTMSTSPVGVEAGDEMIAPVSDETQAEIESNGEEEMPFDGEEMPTEGEEVAMDDFDEESFDELGESYLRGIYENVSSYKTTQVRSRGNRLTVEGVIKFNSGNSKKTSFIFEAKDMTKSGKVRFIGENVNITKGKKAFSVRGRVDGKKFISESLNYNYRQKDESGKSTRVYGTVRTQKRG